MEENWQALVAELPVDSADSWSGRSHTGAGVLEDDVVDVVAKLSRQVDEMFEARTLVFLLKLQDQIVFAPTR